MIRNTKTRHCIDQTCRRNWIKSFGPVQGQEKQVSIFPGPSIFHFPPCNEECIRTAATRTKTKLCRPDCTCIFQPPQQNCCKYFVTNGKQWNRPLISTTSGIPFFEDSCHSSFMPRCRYRAFSPNLVAQKNCPPTCWGIVCTYSLPKFRKDPIRTCSFPSLQGFHWFNYLGLGYGSIGHQQWIITCWMWWLCSRTWCPLHWLEVVFQSFSPLIWFNNIPISFFEPPELRAVSFTQSAYFIPISRLQEVVKPLRSIHLHGLFDLTMQHLLQVRVAWCSSFVLLLQ